MKHTTNVVLLTIYQYSKYLSYCNVRPKTANNENDHNFPFKSSYLIKQQILLALLHTHML